MRQPTPYVDLYLWWNSAVAGENPERFEDEPHCGYYKRKFKKGGPWAPVRVSCLRVLDEIGELAEPERIVAQTDDGPVFDAVKCWTYLRPISKAEFDVLLEKHRTDPTFKATHAQVDLIANPVGPE